MYSTTYSLLQNVANNSNVFEIVSYNGSHYCNENIYSLSTITNSHLKLAPTFKKMYVEILSSHTCISYFEIGTAIPQLT